MRFVILTSLVLTVATATALAQPDPLCQADDRSIDGAAGAADQDQAGRRPGTTPLVAIPASSPLIVPAPAAAGSVSCDEPRDAHVTSSVIAFAPKTSPPPARWF